MEMCAEMASPSVSLGLWLTTVSTAPCQLSLNVLSEWEATEDFGVVCYYSMTPPILTDTVISAEYYFLKWSTGKEPRWDSLVLTPFLLTAPYLANSKAEESNRRLEEVKVYQERLNNNCELKINYIRLIVSLCDLTRPSFKSFFLALSFDYYEVLTIQRIVENHSL